MKDKNGIKIECQNCGAFEYCKDSSAYEQCQNKAFFPSKEAYEARIQDLQAENALLKDGESHIMDVKMSPKFVKSIIRAINSEVEILKRELRFTDEEIDFIEKAISMEILDCETNSPKPSEEKLKLMWGIKIKCDELLKERKD